MRNIVLARVGDRLTRGEVVTAWTPSLSANGIVTVNGIVAADKLNKRVSMALTPQGTKITILSVEGVTKALQEPDLGSEHVIALTETPIVFEQLLDGDVEVKEICLGGMGTRGDHKPFINDVSASPDGVGSIHRMKNEKGVNAYYQLVPEQEVVDMLNLL